MDESNADAGQNWSAKVYLALYGVGEGSKAEGTFSMHDEVSVLFSHGTAPNLLPSSPFHQHHQIIFTNVQFDSVICS